MKLSRGGERGSVFNPFKPGFTDDPYLHWETLRDRDPVHRSPLGYWVLSRYDDIARFIRHPSLGVEESNAAPGLRDKMTRRAFGGDRYAQRAILYIDPPDHTRLRRLMAGVFAPRAIQRLETRIVELCDGSLDQAAGAGRMELIEDYAFPVSFTMISEILGMPRSEADRLREWSSILAGRLELLTGPKLVDTIARTGQQMAAYIGEVLTWKRDKPADDLLTVLISAEREGLLSTDELVDQVSLLYVAGHETSLNLIGNGTLALLNHRSQLEQLVAEPSLDANAVEELLRFDSPVQLSRRITMTDVVVGDRTIPAGSLVACIQASANRDRARWGDDADSVDVTRRDAHEHISFGGGAHYCLGAALARLEGRVAIGRLVRRFPRLEMQSEPAWKARITLRGLERLDLTLSG